MTQPALPGTLTRQAPFPARAVVPREVDVWCPPGYESAGATRYPVLHLHDGQNLFDPATAMGGSPGAWPRPSRG